MITFLLCGVCAFGGMLVAIFLIVPRALYWKHLALIEIPRKAREEKSRLLYVERVAGKALAKIMIDSPDTAAVMTAKYAIEKAWGALRSPESIDPLSKQIASSIRLNGQVKP